MVNIFGRYFTQTIVFTCGNIAETFGEMEIMLYICSAHFDNLITKTD